MSILGSIGLFAAIANYRKAKKTYDDAVERQETLQAAIDSYTQDRDSKYDALLEDTYSDPNSPLQGVLATTILRIGNLVGKYCRIHVCVVLTNTTENTYSIMSTEAVTRVFGAIVSADEDQKAYSGYLLQPGETHEFYLPAAIGMIADEATRDELREAICTANGKSLITSCPKTTINGIETADIALEWRAANGAGSAKRARYVNKAGVLRYCGEAYYP